MHDPKYQTKNIEYSSIPNAHRRPIICIPSQLKAGRLYNRIVVVPPAFFLTGFGHFEPP